MTNHGTSQPSKIGGANLNQKRTTQLRQIHEVGNSLTAPKPNKDGTPSAAFKIQDSLSLFAFSKITPPDYGTDDSVARLTGVPINQPDFIADFHFIGLMRAIDKLILPKNQSLIGGSADTPSATS